MGFDNPSDWELIRRSHLTGVNVSDNPRYPAIPEMVIPVSTHALLVGISSPKAKSDWWLGGGASVKWAIPPPTGSAFTGVTVHEQRCQIGKLNFIQLPKLEPLPYELTISFPYWLSEVDLEIWAYTGVEPTRQLTLEIIEAP